MAQTERTVYEADEPFHLGHRIRRAREAVNQDIQTFAETVGIHRDTLAKYEQTGVAKRAALISIAWATPARLEWLETGELPWRKPVSGPKHDVAGTVTDIFTRKAV
jgi:DNA-binding XRE family transcriptional regulator